MRTRGRRDVSPRGRCLHLTPDRGPAEDFTVCAEGCSLSKAWTSLPDGAASPSSAIQRSEGPSLLALPLPDAHRRSFVRRMAAFVAGPFFATMAISAAVADLAFSALGLVPSHDVEVRAQLTTFSPNCTFCTFWLDLLFGALALCLFWTNSRHPMGHGHHHGRGHAHGDAPARA